MLFGMIVPFYVRTAQKCGTNWGGCREIPPSPPKKNFLNSFCTHGDSKLHRELPSTLNQSLKAAITATVQGVLISP